MRDAIGSGDASSRLALALTGAAAFAVGFALGPEPTPIVEAAAPIAGPTAETPASATRPEAVAVSSTIAAAAPTTPAPLASAVLEWTSTLTWQVDTPTGSVVLRWQPHQTEPELIPLASDVLDARWNRDATLVSLVDGPVLHVGPAGAAEPIALDVAVAVWHADDPLRLAWLSRRDPGSAPPRLVTGRLATDGILLETVELGRLADAAVEQLDESWWQLEAWSDDGFALTRHLFASDGAAGHRTDLVLLDAAGERRSVVEQIEAYRDLGGGLLATRAMATVSSGDAPELVAIDGSTSQLDLEEGGTLIGLDPSGERWAEMGIGRRLVVRHLDERVSFVTPVHDATWTPDGRYLVGLGLGLDVVVFDPENGKVTVLDVPTLGNSAWGLRAH